MLLCKASHSLYLAKLWKLPAPSAHEKQMSYLHWVFPVEVSLEDLRSTLHFFFMNIDCWHKSSFLASNAGVSAQLRQRWKHLEEIGSYEQSDNRGSLDCGQFFNVAGEHLMYQSLKKQLVYSVFHLVVTVSILEQCSKADEKGNRWALYYQV